MIKKKTKTKKPIKKTIKKKIVTKKIVTKKVVKIKKISSSKKKIIKKKIKKKGKKDGVKLVRYSKNPIMSPRSYSWESKATFNPTAFEHDGIINIIYRAVGDDDSSVLGYAYSQNGLSIDNRPTYHIYKRFYDYALVGPSIDYISGGGGSGGCEDPRVVLIGDKIYMIFTAFDGWSSVRLALTSIKLDDFKNKKWNWKKAVYLSPPGEINKNWVIFPEKINGKYAIMHSFYPKILVDYFDSLDDFDGKKFIKSNNTRPIDPDRDWDSWFRGIGPCPIKTKDGWLILYHAMDHKKPDRYRMGAMLLDLNDPTKILHRSVSPILEPEEDYENNGHKWGVIYSCGAVIKNGELFVYYGGADKFVCVAFIKVLDLIKGLKENKVIKLTKNNKVKNN